VSGKHRRKRRNLIALLLRPAGYRGQDVIDTTKKFWKDSYDIIRSSSSLGVVIHDAFQPVSTWNGFMPPPKYEGVLLDTHVYQMFSPEVRLLSLSLSISPN
jgi:glucan 1,3-beta-glucosidase